MLSMAVRQRDSVWFVMQVPWREQEEGALGGQGHAQQEVGLQVWAEQVLVHMIT